jgi:hypothetical protein
MRPRRICGGIPLPNHIAVGPQQGRKVFTLKTLPGIEEPFNGCALQAAGFSLHAGVAAGANSAANWNVCAATTPDQPYLKSACH